MTSSAGLLVDLRIVKIRILGRGMISPDRHVGDARDFDAGLVRELRFGAIFIEPGHGKPAIARNLLRVVHRDQAIGVARIANDEDAHIGGGVLFESPGPGR